MRVKASLLAFVVMLVVVDDASAFGRRGRLFRRSSCPPAPVQRYCCPCPSYPVNPCYRPFPEVIPFPTTTKTASAVQTIWINGDQDGYNIFDNTQPGEATYGDVNHSDETNPVSLIVKVFPQITLEVGGASVDLNLQQVRAFVWPVTAPAPADYQSAHQLLWNYMHVGTHLQGFDFPGGEHRYLVGAHLDLADIPGQKENNFVGVWALYSGAGYNVYARYPFDAPALFFGVGP